MTDHLEFNLIPQDLAEATIAMRRTNWGRYERLRLALAGACIVLMIYMVMVAFMWRQHGIFLLGWEDALAFAFAGAVLGLLYGRLWTNPGEDDPRLMARSFDLREDGFETDGPGFHTEIDWTSVAEIGDRGPVIVFVTEWREAFFIPKRAFATPEAAADFLARARALYAARWDHFTAGPGAETQPARRFDLAWRPERSDIAAFAGLRREITGWRKFLFFAPFFLAGAVLAFLGDEFPVLGTFLEENNGTTLAMVLIFCGLIYLVSLLLQRVLRARRVRRTPLPEGEMFLGADDTGIDVTSGGKRTHYSWKQIPAVTLGNNHVFLATARDRAIIVPRRAFRNRALFLAFANFAEEASKNAEA